MKKSVFTKVLNYLEGTHQWYLSTTDRALEQAYEAALRIKAIEDEHFRGNIISPANSQEPPSVYAYFESELQSCLKTARTRLVEFRASRSFLNALHANSSVPPRPPHTNPDLEPDQQAATLEKLRFIDSVTAKYSADTLLSSPASTSLSIIPRESPPRSEADRSTLPVPAPPRPEARDRNTNPNEAITDKSSVLPRSILKTVDRIKRELDPKAEEEVVKSFRTSKIKTIISIRFVLLLILVPLLTQQVAKNFLVGPIVEQVRSGTEVNIFINTEMEENALQELQRFEERLKFENLLQGYPHRSQEEIEAALQTRAGELAREYSEASNDAVKNVFADLISLIAFVAVLVSNRREIEILKSFIDEVVYGLSDSAKAFIIILFTDIFVGFHSPHGWEVLLEGVSRHLGLPENRSFIFLFIATFPVILDTIFKYWIFRYLNRVSPSAVATYRNMNE